MTKNLGRKLTALLLVFVLAMSMVITASAEEESTESSTPELLSVVIVSENLNAGNLYAYVEDASGNNITPTNGITAQNSALTLTGTATERYTSSSGAKDYFRIVIASATAADVPSGNGVESAAFTTKTGSVSFIYATSSYGDVVYVGTTGSSASGATRGIVEGDLVYFVYAVEVNYVAQNVDTGAQYETVQEAVDAAASGETVQLLCDVTENVTVAAGQVVTLDLNGCVLDGGSDLAVTVYGEVTIQDSSENADGYLTANTSKLGSGLYICSGGTATLTSGGVKNCSVSSNGGAVVVLSKATFNMTGGFVSDSTGGKNGAGVYVNGGGEFNMSGGVISGNTAANYGGGVFVNASSTAYGTFNMTGGTITGNTAKTGGGVHLYQTSSGYAVMNMSGGTIIGNTATSYGGGVSVSGILNMTGGYIYNNEAGSYSADIHVGSKGSATLAALSADDGLLDAEGHFITGWYVDKSGSRWTEENFASATEQTELTFSGYAYLKAAHGAKISEPGIAKSADVDTASAGDTVTYTLASTVPEGLLTYTYSDSGAVATCDAYVLTFHDVMPDGMTASTDSIEVKVGTTVIDTAYYTVSAGTDCTFEVAVDLAALYNNGVIGFADLGVSSVTVTYTATVGATTGALTNTAWVTWDEGTSVEASATVTTYGVSIYKYDLADTSVGLAGAEFTLTDASGNVVATVTSGEDGTVSIVGLAAGTYYLTETSAPEGYVASEEAITISTDDATDYVVSVSVANAQVPTTGGAGTAMYTMGGIGILLAAAALFLVSRKSRRNAQ